MVLHYIEYDDYFNQITLDIHLTTIAATLSIILLYYYYFIDGRACSLYSI